MLQFWSNWECLHMTGKLPEFSGPFNDYSLKSLIVFLNRQPKQCKGIIWQKSLPHHIQFLMLFCHYAGDITYICQEITKKICICFIILSNLQSWLSLIQGQPWEDLDGEQPGLSRELTSKGVIKRTTVLGSSVRRVDSVRARFMDHSAGAEVGFWIKKNCQLVYRVPGAEQRSSTPNWIVTSFQIFFIFGTLSLIWSVMIKH